MTVCIPELHFLRFTTFISTCAEGAHYEPHEAFQRHNSCVNKTHVLLGKPFRPHKEKTLALCCPKPPATLEEKDCVGNPGLINNTWRKKISRFV